MSRILALVDCNNFYVSCERVFEPGLRNKPVVVLSNNDGCIVSRSNEAKAIGIGMGAAYFKTKDILDKHDVEVFSSNYALYGDMSSRVMRTLSGFTPSMEIYSIDEAFLDLSGMDVDLDDYGREIRKTVLQWTAMPVSVGIAKTKTLAKIANHIAKKSVKAQGVLDLTSGKYIDKALEITDVGDVWGIGRRISAKLKKVGITTAKQLADTDVEWIRKRFSITAVRTVLELRGQNCFELEQVPEPNKSIAVSRTFGRDVEDIEQLRQSLAVYVSRAAEKLRRQKLHAHVLTIYAMSSRFDKQGAYYNSASHVFDPATDSSLEFVKQVEMLSTDIFRSGVKFKKAGVVLSKLVPDKQLQLNLFTDTQQTARDQRLMEVLDIINHNSKKIYFAAEGIEKPWQTKFNHRSARYTTRWNELVQVV